MAKKNTKNVKKSTAAATHARGAHGRHGLGRGLGALIGDVDLSDVSAKPLVRKAQEKLLAVKPVQAKPVARKVAAKAVPKAKPVSKKPSSGRKPVEAKAPVVAPIVEEPAVQDVVVAEPQEVAPAVAPMTEEVKVAIELDEPAAEESVLATPAVATATEPPHEGAVLQVATYLIGRSPWQPRVDFNPENLRELSESIKAHGVIQPLVCRRLPEEKGGGYELIAGERRLRAAIEAGLTEVPIVVMEAVDRDAAEMAIVENIQRQDLNIIEEAEGYRTLSEGFGLTQQEVADRVGKARASVANAMRLLDLPDEVKQLLSSQMLSVGHAKVLLSLPEETEQILLARRCVTDGLTVRALERLIARRKAAKDEAKARTLDMPESHIRYLLDKLHERFNSPIRLQPSVTYANGKRAKGSIQIDFVDNEDLSRLLEIFGVKVD